ncbi:hypothetical protein DL93DRAFT_2071767 [Clavulina sp. PMI_390]|nr:hypothetical protein DL93DRAFT_2071767 [Clavulina sp. PMI_390]
MAKSLRSKAKRTFRRTKREVIGTDYQVTDAARLNRLSSKLREKFSDKEAVGDEDADEAMNDAAAEDGDEILADEEKPTGAVDGSKEGTASSSTKISTSGPRLSRRAEWRVSKGMTAQPNRPNKLNKQGTPKARRKSGRSHRRR